MFGIHVKSPSDLSLEHQKKYKTPEDSDAAFPPPPPPTSVFIRHSENPLNPPPPPTSTSV